MWSFGNRIIRWMTTKFTKPTNDEALQRNSEVERHLKIERKNANKTYKILLLGAGESGKSTVIKQMRILYSGGFSEGERRDTRAVIYDNMISAFKALLDIMSVENIGFGTDSAKPSADLITKTEPNDFAERSSLGEALSDAMRCLWMDSGFQIAVARSHDLPFHENMLYFYNSIDLVSTPGWIPCDQDFLQARFRTTGIAETTFKLGATNLRMVDVGGQRSERKKWIHCFEDVSCMIFVAAISGYDQRTAEDPNANQMHEAFILFDLLVNSEHFKHTPIILFLNKIDIFKKKLAVSPLSQYYADFTGCNTDLYAAASLFRPHELLTSWKKQDVITLSLGLSYLQTQSYEWNVGYREARDAYEPGIGGQKFSCTSFHPKPRPIR
ncbi:Fungal G-protein, alpha subunit [Penicillium italicum]|uniref:Fungal G-protein, alpha subunit n=1 Tax=Penicillium italicum TaxID=40296 RepID=A0A0A2KY44_PENIT|nr:Fungal G-protein, alpha subunit [Penicillium italicum]